MHHSPPVKFLVLIEAADGMVARLFDAAHCHVVDFDASTEEVASMIAGQTPDAIGDTPVWSQALAGHSAAQRRAAQVYSLGV